MPEEEIKNHNVRELLTETKDVSDSIIDLAYASILYEDKEMAKQVRKLENRMDELMYQIRVLVAMSARSYEDAEMMTGILQIASAAESISNAAGDLANLVLREIDIHPVIKDTLKYAEEKISRLVVGADSDLIGERLRDLKLPSQLAIWVLAIKRDDSWKIMPDSDETIEEGDTIFVRGPQDGVDKLSFMADSEEIDWTVSEKYERLRKLLSDMRDTGCLLVDLAFYSILFKSKEVAEEVRKLEERFDELNYEAWREVLKASKKEENVMYLNSALQIVKSLESISDAADSISDIMLRGVEMHPVFEKALEQADENIARVQVSPDSSLTGRTLEKLDLWRRRGVYVLVLRKGDSYILNPSKKTVIDEGDVLIIRGSFKSVEELTKVARGEKLWKDLEIVS